MDLSGVWRVTWSDSGRGLADKGVGEKMDPSWYFDANVPGELHLDMMAAGIVDDPRVGINVLKARWVEDVLWSYRKHFEVPKEALSGRCWLYLESIDLAADIYLNGEKIASHSNYFYPCRVEITGKLYEGTNRLVVQVESGLIYGANKSVDGLSDSNRDKLTKRVWLRKPQFQAQWDWAPRMMNVGLSGPVRLEWTTDPIRADQFVPLPYLDDNLQTGTLEARWFVEGLSTETVTAEMTVAIPELNLKTTEQIEIQPGENRCTATLDVHKPKLWWPVGHGEPYRYEITASLSIGGREIARSDRNIGFRRVVVNQEPHPSKGRYFTLEINNRKIFCKGGNWVPADMIYSSVTRERLEKLIDLSCEANFNILRIWGGGLYETNDFYDLCDEKGVLVWQEFIFACGKYPGYDEAFHQDFVKEATWNVRRLANHPSLVIYCGNNEMEWGTEAWGYRNGTMFPDRALFHFTLPRIMAEEDPTRFYWPSSPYSLETEHPNADNTGDQHPWILGFADTETGMNFLRFRELECRFPNEGGFLGPNSLPTTRACLMSGQESMHSFSWRLHDNNFFNDACKFWLGKERSEMTIEEYVYWGGLLHGEALREYCDSFRRKMFTCSSAIFWMYNDCWPCSRSWTIVDYYLRRTPAFHPVRRAMAPVAVVLAEENGVINIYGINDTHKMVECEVRYGIFELAGNYLQDTTQKVALFPNSSVVLAIIPSGNWTMRKRSMPFAILTDTMGKCIARNKLYEGFWKDMIWPKAAPEMKVENGEVIFSSKTFVLGVCLDLDGECTLADNYFDLYPGLAYTIPWTEPEPPKILNVGNLTR